MPADRPLRIGLMLDSLTQPQWVYDIVRDIQGSTIAEVSLLIENADVERPERGVLRRLARNRHRVGYTLYSRLDDTIYRRTPDAFTDTSIADLVRDVRSISVRPRKKKFSDFFEPSDVEAIRAYDLDVALRLGFRILRGDALQIARHGVWSYHHGDNLVNRGGPPGFWEVMQGEPVTGSVLQIISDELDNGRVIYRSYAPTDRRSVRRNIDNLYRKTGAFVMRKLRDLHEFGEPALDADPHTGEYTAYSRPLYREPGNLQMLSLGTRLAARVAGEKIRKVAYHDQWGLAVRMHPGSSTPEPAMHRYKFLLPPQDRFWADPFPVTYRGRHHVFVEELPYSTNKGHITALELDAPGRVSSTQKVLELEHHLSYPFVFEWEGSHFMVPESGARRRVELYRADDFPGGWRPEQVLLEGLYAVDATLEQVDGTWWMFANVGAEGTWNYDELHIFHAPSPRGPWSPHRGNPVKSDARCARPAGRLFRWNGHLYRPAQDCSGAYGAAIVINRVLRLTTTEYREVAVSRLEPKWQPNLLGTHTINAADGFSVVDVLVRRPRWAPGADALTVGATRETVAFRESTSLPRPAG